MWAHSLGEEGEGKGVVKESREGNEQVGWISSMMEWTGAQHRGQEVTLRSFVYCNL